MRALVTGATGYLGRHLLEALGDARAHRTALVRSAHAYRAEPWTAAVGDVALVEGLVTEPATLSSAPGLRPDPAGGRFDCIYHLAGKVAHTRLGAAETLRVNVEGTLAMVRLASAHRARLVFVSTSGTVGCFRHEDQHADEQSPYCTTTIAHWPYYDSKRRAEEEARKLAARLDVELVIVRPPVLLGPGDHRYRSTSHVSRLIDRRLPFVPGGGIHFADVRDVARALVAIGSHDRPRPIYHTPGHSMPLRRFFGLCHEVSSVAPPSRRVPYWLQWSLATVNEGVGTLRGSPTRWLPDPVVIEMAARHWDMRSLFAEQDLGYTPRAARQTLADTVTWLRAHPR
jgi:nucleoside-diphosphate-sugar epimerase